MYTAGWSPEANLRHQWTTDPFLILIWSDTRSVMSNYISKLLIWCISLTGGFEIDETGLSILCQRNYWGQLHVTALSSGINSKGEAPKTTACGHTGRMGSLMKTQSRGGDVLYGTPFNFRSVLTSSTDTGKYTHGQAKCTKHSQLCHG